MLVNVFLKATIYCKNILGLVLCIGTWCSKTAGDYKQRWLFLKNKTTPLSKYQLHFLHQRVLQQVSTCEQFITYETLRFSVQRKHDWLKCLKHADVFDFCWTDSSQSSSQSLQEREHRCISWKPKLPLLKLPAEFPLSTCCSTFPDFQKVIHLSHVVLWSIQWTSYKPNSK